MFKILIIWNIALTVLLIIIMWVITKICANVNLLMKHFQVDIYRHAIGRYFNHD